MDGLDFNALGQELLPLALQALGVTLGTIGVPVLVLVAKRVLTLLKVQTNEQLDATLRATALEIVLWVEEQIAERLQTAAVARNPSLAASIKAQKGSLAFEALRELFPDAPAQALDVAIKSALPQVGLGASVKE